MAQERSLGKIVIHDPRGYGYLPKIVRKEVGVEGKGEIPFYVDANCVLLVRKDASEEDIIEGLELLKNDLKLRWKQNRNES